MGLRTDLVLLLGAAAAIQACSTSTPMTTPTPPPAATVTSVPVNGTAPAVGATARFTATAALSNNTTQDVTTQAAWQSSNAGVATVSAAGVVTAIASGEADITATYQSVAGRSHVAIAPSGGRTFSVAGVITDGTTGGVLPDIYVQATDSRGTNSAARSDARGAYSIGALGAGDVTLRASAESYDDTSRTVTLNGDLRVDLVMPRTSPCAYQVAEAIDADRVPSNGGRLTVSLVRTMGRCGWQASTNDSWIALANTSGGGSAAINYSVAPNPLPAPGRTGGLTVTWTGGRLTVNVVQTTCAYFGPQLPSMTMSPGGGTLGPMWIITSFSLCNFGYTTDAAWLSLGRSNTGITATAPRNTTGSTRTGVITGTWPAGGRAQMMIVQPSS